MSRSVNEWVGASDDAPIPPRVRVRVFDSTGGRCAMCGRVIMGGERWDCDHTVAIINGGENRESNLRPLCVSCHKSKTAVDTATKGLTNRIRYKALGVKQSKTPMPCGRKSKWKKRMDGTIVPR